MNQNAYATEGGHWYTKDGKPCHEVPNKSKPGTMRPTKLGDARKLGLLPSVTKITKQLHNEQIVKFRIKEAAHALMTSPRKEGENEDAFIERVLWQDKEHEEVAAAARDLGTDVHAAVEMACRGREFDKSLAVYVDAVMPEVAKLGRITDIEGAVVNVDAGYGGKLDLCVQGNDDLLTVVDFKTCKNIPRESYQDHKLQLAAYACAIGRPVPNIQTCNIYISTTEPGKVAVYTHGDVDRTFHFGFFPLLRFWQWDNNYFPDQSPE